LLKRGFKTQCEQRSLTVRKGLGLEPVAPLNAMDLATYLGVTVWSADQVRHLPLSDRQHLLEVAPDEWSAFVLHESGKFLVLYNPRHSPGRTNSDIMHELAHIMLGHGLTEVQETNDGHLLSGHHDKDQEDEADWLGGTLLLPRPALLWMRRRRLSDDAAADHFGVSRDMLRWRVRMTGVDYQLARS
jgi:hypothetical protein